MKIVNDDAVIEAYKKGATLRSLTNDAAHQVSKVYNACLATTAKLKEEEEKKLQEENKRKKEEEAKLAKEREQLLDSSMGDLAKFFTSFVKDPSINKDDFSKQLKKTFIESMDGTTEAFDNIDGLLNYFKKREQASSKDSDKTSAPKRVHYDMDDGFLDLLIDLPNLPWSKW